MKNSTNQNYPIVRKGESGFWYAYGRGWAVYAPTKKAVEQEYDKMLKLINDLISRPLNTAGDIL